ncbi:hypothetical protein [Chishuiella sp.]|uniref:hypothetical protein n=1 Tax=Chishuiella sp. TaxID=1969467 RepID=UPI0028AAC765|nr:hypothetical protein [Chishuiella sp.]
MKTIIFLFQLLFICSCTQKTINTENDDFHSEIIKEVKFENVIEITDKNIITTKGAFLFDVSIPKTIDLPIIFVQNEVPLKLLSTIYPDFSRLIIITPNWTYYNEMSNMVLPDGIICAEPIASSVIYEFNQENGKLLKDSLVIMGGFPEMKFINNKNYLKNNQKKVYYTENYDSIDYKKDNKSTPEEFITLFERENNINIIDTYKENKRKDKKSNYFYTLEGLSDEMKLKFILERDFQKAPKIYTPSILEINDRMIKL